LTSKLRRDVKEIMDNYEQRINDIEIEMVKKCDEPRAREIVKEELELNSCNEHMVKKIVEEVITGEGKNLQSEILARERQPKKETVSTVIDELNERKTKEKNLLIFGLKENVSEILQEREGHDIENILQLFKDAKITLEQENIQRTQRLGKFDKEKACRPLLVQLQSVEAKITLFKNIHYMKALPKYKDINVSNDLTKTERARKKELWEEAKKMKDKDDSGDYKYKVRGSGKKVFHGVNVKSLQFYPN
jgi:hypothetical protein